MINTFLVLMEQGNTNYRDKMLNKQKVFGSVLLKTKNEMIDYVNRLCEM